MLMFLKIGSIVAGVFGKTVSDRAAKVLGMIAFALLVVALFLGGKALYDRKLIRDHEAAEYAKDVEAALKGERAANAGQADRDKASADLHDKIDAATDEAAKADPAGAAKSVGPTTKAYYDTLRKEKKQ